MKVLSEISNVNIRDNLYRLLLAIFFCFHGANSSHAEDQYNESPYNLNALGSVGLIQTPTARFSEDGELLFGISSEEPYNRLFANMQFFPWLESTVRYTEATYERYGPGNPQTYKDKGIDLKLKIFENKEDQLSIALGLTDFGGTGLFSSEYLVASKRYNNFDFSLGLGWGRLGGLNHLDNFVASLDTNRKERGGLKNIGGFNLQRLFSGEYVSLFGGFEYFTPINDLTLKVEYDSSDYSDAQGKELKFDETGNIFKVDSRVNYALNYRIKLSERDRANLSLGFLRGNTIYANLSVQSNLNFSGTPRYQIGGEKIRNTNLPGGDSFQGLDRNRKDFLFKRTIREMDNIGFVTHAIIYDNNEISAEISQGRFLNTIDAIDLASRVLANNSPRNIEKITIIMIDNGIETMRSTVRRDELIDSVKLGPLEASLIEFNSYIESSPDKIKVANDFLYPNFFWELRPKLNTTIQHQRRFFFWQLEALFHSVYSIKKGLYLTTDIGLDIDNNFDSYTFHVPDGELFHVRQDRRLYLTEGESGIRRMALDYFIDLHPNVKAQLSLGYLEWMYGGVGGELLYMPDHKRWSVGIDAYWVKQREFDQKFSFRDYETVTGFVSYYQEIPFYDMRLKLSAGKFLGKDVGAMIDVSRRFKSGARVGGFAALTDCDAKCVGEGSFHKGIYFELPMDLFYIQSTTRKKTGYSWSPLNKDAGAEISRIELYELMTDGSDEVDQLRPKSWSVKKILTGFGTEPKKKI